MAAGSNGIRAGRAYVELGVHDKLAQGLRKAEMKLKAFGAGVSSMGLKMAGLGAALVAPMAYFIKAASDAEQATSKFNIVFGSNAAEVQKWSDTYAKHVGRAKKQITEFLSGNQDLFVPLGFESEAAEEISKTLTRLAIDLASFNDKADADVMRDLQAAMTGSSEVMKKYGVIVDETAVKQDMLNKGINPKTATQQQKVLSRLSIILAGTTAAQGNALQTSGQFANQLKRLKAWLADVSVTIGSALLPTVNAITQRINAAGETIGKWVEENRGLVVTLFKVAASVTVAGVALVAIGGTISLLGFAFGALAKAVTLAVASIKVMAAVSAAFISPIGAVVAAVGALGGYLLIATDAGGKALGWLGDQFNILKSDALTAWQGIGSALAAGDIGAAAKILWLTLKMEWTRGIAGLKKFMEDFKFGLLSLHEILVAGVSEKWLKLWSAMKSGWQEFQSWHSRQVETWANWMAKRWIDIQEKTGQITADDAKFRRAHTDQQSDQELRKIETQRQAGLNRIETEKQAALAANDEVHKTRMAALSTENQAREDAIDQQIKQARKEWNDALAANREAMKAQDATGGPSRTPSPLSAQQIATPNLAALAQRISVVGTFNASAAAGLGTGNAAAERTATATEKTATAAEETARNTRSSGLAFS